MEAVLVADTGHKSNVVSVAFHPRIILSVAVRSTAPRHAVPFATNAMLHASHKECGTNAPAVDDLQVTGSGHTAAQDKQAEAAQTKVSRDGALLILSKSSTTAGGTCAWSGEMPSWQAIASQIWTHFMTASMASCAHERLTCVVHEALFGLGHHGAPSQATVATKNDKRLPNGRKSLKLRGLCNEMHRQQRLRKGWDKPKPTSLPRMVRKQYKGVLMITPIGMGSELHSESVRSCYADIQLWHHGATGTELQGMAPGRGFVRLEDIDTSQPIGCRAAGLGVPSVWQNLKELDLSRHARSTETGVQLKLPSADRCYDHIVAPQRPIKCLQAPAAHQEDRESLSLLGLTDTCCGERSGKKTGVEKENMIAGQDGVSRHLWKTTEDTACDPCDLTPVT
ncbi:hypothetical protein AK812_SmicGene5179 [Symbiodinium microadriaticum]|uniref:Uncharacterized protein n=1 Tax=Symbiodinium microadriaticum TaxID=2951 RepID=A0A1Q9EUD8_SYMMI|nr:hypothetical protein AK812_SmicGene5179 [Symbiodinium microadriaticum]